MSAYVVKDETISVIVKALEFYEVEYEADGYKNPIQIIYNLAELRQKIGQSLLEQNYKSVNYRYNENTQAHEFQFKDVNLTENRKINTGLILGCIRCYEYQASEPNDYSNSKIHMTLNYLKEKMLAKYIIKDGFEIDCYF